MGWDKINEDMRIEERARQKEKDYLKGFYEFAVDAYHESSCFPVEFFIRHELDSVAERYMETREEIDSIGLDDSERRLYFEGETLSNLDCWLRKTYPFMGDLYRITHADLKKFSESTVTPDKECETILEEANRIVKGERQADYADPVINFRRISKIASAVRGKDLDMLDCVTVQIATKLARQQNKHKRDNLVDLAGYAYIWHLIEEFLEGLENERK